VSQSRFSRGDKQKTSVPHPCRELNPGRPARSLVQNIYIYIYVHKLKM